MYNMTSVFFIFLKFALTNHRIVPFQLLPSTLIYLLNSNNSKNVMFIYIRNRGIIVNMSSMCALIPVPLLAVYSATKVTVQF